MSSGVLSSDSEKNLANLYESLGDLRYDFRNYNLNRLIASRVRGTTVLDIGCGNGFLAGVLVREGKKVIAIEPNRDLIALAKKRTPGLTVIEGSAETMGQLISDPVDAIVAIDVLEHLDDDGLVLRTMYRLLLPEGNVVIVVPAYQWFFGSRDKKHGHRRRYSRRLLRERLKEAGFAVTEMRSWNIIGILPYLIAEKILHRGLESDLRTAHNMNLVKKALNGLFHWWFRAVENTVSFGIGLSIVCVAKKI